MVSTNTPSHDRWSVIRRVARRVLLGELPPTPPILPMAPLSSYRGRLLAVHGALATVAVLAFISQSSGTSLSHAGAGSGDMTVLGLAFPALIPYIVSILSSHAWLNKPPRNVIVFLVLLVSTGVAAALLTVDAFGWHLGPLAQLGVYLARPAVNMSIELKDGAGVGVTNLGMPGYQVAFGINDGWGSPEAARRFADTVLARLKKRWRIELVADPAQSGALPMKDCN